METLGYEKLIGSAVVIVAAAGQNRGLIGAMQGLRK